MHVDSAGFVVKIGITFLKRDMKMLNSIFS